MCKLLLIIFLFSEVVSAGTVLLRALQYAGSNKTELPTSRRLAQATSPYDLVIRGSSTIFRTIRTNRFSRRVRIEGRNPALVREMLTGLQEMPNLRHLEFHNVFFEPGLLAELNQLRALESLSITGLLGSQVPQLNELSLPNLQVLRIEATEDPRLASDFDHSDLSRVPNEYIYEFDYVYILDFDTLRERARRNLLDFWRLSRSLPRLRRVFLDNVRLTEELSFVGISRRFDAVRVTAVVGANGVNMREVPSDPSDLRLFLINAMLVSGLRLFQWRHSPQDWENLIRTLSPNEPIGPNEISLIHLLFLREFASLELLAETINYTENPTLHLRDENGNTLAMTLVRNYDFLSPVYRDVTQRREILNRLIEWLIGNTPPEILNQPNLEGRTLAEYIEIAVERGQLNRSLAERLRRLLTPTVPSRAALARTGFSSAGL